MIALLLILNAYYVASSGKRLERRLTVLRRADEPLQLADLARQPIPPEQNAEVFLRRAADDLDAMQKELIAWYPKVGYPTGALSPADQERLEGLFNAYPKVVPLLEQAADCPDFDPQLDTTLPPTGFLQPFMDRTGKHRVISRVLRARSILLVAKGDTDEALTTQVLLLRVTRKWLREPLIIGYLVTAVCETVAMETANQVLQSGPVSATARQSLDAELALHDNLDGLHWALRSERAYTLSSVREIPGWDFWLARGFVNDLMVSFLDLYDRHLTDASRPYWEVASAKNDKTRSPGRSNPLGALVTLLEPALVALRVPAERVRTISRSLCVLNALQSRPDAGNDQVPQLNDLGLSVQVTTDPFSDEPLRVKKLPEGWMVYSVGSNLIDDGGKLDGNTDIGIGPVRPEELKANP